MARRAWLWLAARRVPGNRALIAAGVALAFFIQLYNCFGMATGAEDGHTRFVQTFLAPWLPRPAAPRDAITVLLYDKSSFDDLDIDIPILPYDRQAEVLAKVAAQKPAAIFIDASYRRDLSDPQGVTVFLQAIQAVRATGIPVYIGEVKPRRAARDTFTDADAFFDDAPHEDSGRAKALDAFARLRDDAVRHDYQTGTLFAPDHAFDYPVETKRVFPEPGNAAIETPAFRLYRDICRHPAPGLKCSAKDLAALKKPDLPPMAVQWLSYSGQPADGYCRLLARGDPLTLMSDVARNIYRKPARREGYLYNPCLYLRTVTLNQVLGAAAGDPALAKHFTGKVVMIGSALGDDTVVAPDQGKAPGVLLHAMALENLLTWGADYHRWPQEIELFGGSIGVDFFIDLLLVFLASRAASDIEKRFAENHGAEAKDVKSRRRDLAVYFLAAAGIAMVLSIAAMLITYVWLHWTPINAQAITLAVLAIAGVEKYRELIIEATRWSVAGIVAFLITAGLLSWFVLSVFVTNDIFDPGLGPTLHNRPLILWSGLTLAAWTAGLIYGYRRNLLRYLKSFRRAG